MPKQTSVGAQPAVRSEDVAEVMQLVREMKSVLDGVKQDVEGLKLSGSSAKVSAENEARTLTAAGANTDKRNVATALEKLAGAKGQLEDLLKDASANDERLVKLQQGFERETTRRGVDAQVDGAAAQVVYAGAPPAVYGGAPPSVYIGSPSIAGQTASAEQKAAVQALAATQSKLEKLLQDSTSSLERVQSLENQFTALEQATPPTYAAPPPAAPALTYVAPPPAAPAPTVPDKAMLNSVNEIQGMLQGLLKDSEANTQRTGVLEGSLTQLMVVATEATPPTYAVPAPTYAAPPPAAPAPTVPDKAMLNSVNEIQGMLQGLLKDSEANTQRTGVLESSLTQFMDVAAGTEAYAVGSVVEVYSSSDGKWYADGKVIKNPEGIEGVTVRYNNDAKTKLILKSVAATQLRVPNSPSKVQVYSAPQANATYPSTAVTGISPSGTAGLANVESLLNQLLKDQQDSFQKSQSLLQTAETLESGAGQQPAVADSGLADGQLQRMNDLQAKLDQQKQLTRDEKAKASALEVKLRAVEQADKGHAAALKEMEEAAAAGQQSAALLKRLEQAESQLSAEQATTADLQGKLTQSQVVASQRQEQLIQVRKESASDKVLAQRATLAEERAAQASNDRASANARATAAERQVATLQQDAERSAKARQDLNTQIGELKASLKEVAQGGAPGADQQALYKRAAEAEQKAADAKKALETAQKDNENKMQTLTKEFEGEFVTIRRDLTQATRGKDASEEKVKASEARHKTLQDRNDAVIRERDSLKSQLEATKKERDGLKTTPGEAPAQPGADTAALQRKLATAETRATAAETMKRSIDTELRTTKRQIEREQAKATDAETRRKAAEDRAIAAEAAAKAGGSSASPPSGDVAKLERQAKDAEARMKSLQLERNGFQIQLQKKDQELKDLRAGTGAATGVGALPASRSNPTTLSTPPSYISSAYAPRSAASPPTSPAAAVKAPTGSTSSLYSQTAAARAPGTTSSLYSSTRPAGSAAALSAAGGATATSTSRLYGGSTALAPPGTR